PSRPPGTSRPATRLQLPSSSAAAKTPSLDLKKNSPGYAPKRGQDYAFQVEMSTTQGSVVQQWVGTLYFAGVYSELHSAFGEMLCIGRLSCRTRTSPDGRWSLVSFEDI